MANRITNSINTALNAIKFFFLICKVKFLQKRALKRVKGKQQFNCVFLVLESSTWKYDGVYQIMSRDNRFNPVILVCPIVNYGEANMLEKMEKCYHFFMTRGYNVIKAYDDENKSYIDIRALNPDILFYTNPYYGFIDSRYFITNYLDILTVYVPYFFNCSIVKGFSNDLPLHNLVWRKYVETDFEFQLSKIEQKRRGQNVVITGYPGIEKLIDPKYTPSKNPWKSDNLNLKKIIWAPHHTIEKGKYGHTCFLEYCDYMLDLAHKYEKEVQIAFKPHPILRSKLVVLWGKERTDAYYHSWESMPNTTIHEDDYIDLFITSDAMIHDSGSFIVEYLYVNKPVLRTINDLPLSEQFNSFGLDCLKQYYHSNTKEDVERFVQNVIEGVDPLKEQRTRFIENVLIPQGSPSQNIIDDILYSIDNQQLYRN